VGHRIKTESGQPKWKNLELDDGFQALFFKVAGITFAVPLSDLSGIHQFTMPVTHIIDKPDWFLGVISVHETVLNLVDTAAWLHLKQPIETQQSKYYITLGSSKWCLACDSLAVTKRLNKDHIQWRKKAGNRSWAAGIVKDEKCVLVHADELIKLLDS